MNYIQNTYAYDTEVYGNTVRKLNVAEPYEAPGRRTKQEIRKQPRHATMSISHMLILVASLAVCAVILVNYIQLRSELTNTIHTVAGLESQVNSLKQDNEDTYSRIMNSIDLENIKRIAIGELGMTYATEGQIVVYDPVESDYMRAIY